MVKDFKHEYASNSRQVRLSWSKLDGASVYAIYVGTSPDNMVKIDTVPTLEYIYRLKVDDPNTLYMAVQGLSSDIEYVRTNPKVVQTFIYDQVENLSANYNASTSKAEVRWNYLYRADGYELYKNGTKIDPGTSDGLIHSNSFELSNVNQNDTLIVKGIMNVDENKYYSKASNEVVVIDSESDIKISTVDSIQNKIYGDPLAFELDFDIKRDASKLYRVNVELVLNNLFSPTDSTMLAEFVYPKLEDVEIVDTSNNSLNVTYSSEISTGRMIDGTMNGNAGYSVVISIPDNQTNYLSKDKKLRVDLRTDFRLTDTIVRNSSYARMELPFHIEEQIAAIENALTTPVFSDGTYIDAIISYKLEDSDTAETYTKYQRIDFDFVNKRMLIGE
jgi:hypothetical protein